MTMCALATDAVVITASSQMRENMSTLCARTIHVGRHRESQNGLGALLEHLESDTLECDKVV